MSEQCSVCIFRFWCRDMQIIPPDDCGAFRREKGK